MLKQNYLINWGILLIIHCLFLLLLSQAMHTLTFLLQNYYTKTLTDIFEPKECLLFVFGKKIQFIIWQNKM